MDDELKNYAYKYKKSNKSEDFSKNMFKMIVHNFLFNFIQDIDMYDHNLTREETVTNNYKLYENQKNNDKLPTLNSARIQLYQKPSTKYKFSQKI